MKCIYCGWTESKVIDSRSTEELNSIRRRRECLNCGKCFTTYETVETAPLLVIKTDGSRQPFDPLKVRKGIIKACEKRPVSIDQINQIVTDIEKDVYADGAQEISSIKIGEMVMEKLKDLDEISYIRFACVYRRFEDVSNLIKFLENIKK
ncbi:MAG: transcriptional repressor NrdR [Clostridia bacterium]|nr:transcriptional repressor NrdR [Clostridia bacterium]